MDKEMKVVNSRGCCGGCGGIVWTFHPVHAPYGQQRVLDKESVYWHLSCFIKNKYYSPTKRAPGKAATTSRKNKPTYRP